jgi:hypothetical protein
MMNRMRNEEPLPPRDPRFSVLDIVEIEDEPRWRGVVTQVTWHPDGEIKYSVRELTDDPDYMAGHYPRAWLGATGETAPAAMFALPGGFREGDVVVVAANCGDDECAGRPPSSTAARHLTVPWASGLRIWVRERHSCRSS